MSQTIIARKWALVAALIVVAGSGVGIYLWRVSEKDNPSPPANSDQQYTAGFRECAVESGIGFHMDFLASEQGVIPFKINLYDHGCGVAVGDFDGDGWDDIFFTNQLGRCALYRNLGDGTFEDVTKKARVGLGDRICVGAVWCDYDNDGYLDLYVTSTRGGNVLFRNNGNGTFTDATEAAKVGCVAHSQTAVFFDYNNDGYADLFVTNSAKWTLNNGRSQRFFPGPESLIDLAKSPIEENRLFRNNGDGTFTDVTAVAGLQGKGWGGDVSVFDFNEDGYLDLMVTNMFGMSQLYRNNGNGTFTDVTKDKLKRTSWGAIGCKAFDFNNDGRLDLFITDMHSDMWLPESINPNSLEPGVLNKKYLYVLGFFYDKHPQAPEREKTFADLFHIRYESVVFGNTFFKRLPSGEFQEISDKANLETFWPWGIATGDFDNNGFADIFIPAGMGFPYAYWPNSLMMNNGDETFTDRAAAEGIDPPPGGTDQERPIANLPASRSSRAAAVADFRHNGQLDVVVNNFNERAYLYRNQFPAKNYVEFRLTGAKGKSDPLKESAKKSCRDAIGALVTLHMGKGIMVRQVETAGGYLSQSSRTLHFGLGDRTAIDWVDIRWPSGLRERIDAPAINQRHDVAEGHNKPTP
jgi:enediyne biosynthesis protein E4